MANLKNLKQIAADLGIIDYVNFLGNLSHEEVLRTLLNSHLFVFPTREAEGFPKALLEALACGLPAVTSSVSVIPNLIGNRNGIVLQNPDHTSVADAVNRLISDDKLLNEMSENACKTAMEFTLKRWRNVIGDKLRHNWGPLRKDIKVQSA